jgi:hypothetical protein
MVFPIPPINLPDTSTPSSSKIKIEAVNKIAPVVLNDQVSVDARTAVKLPDPVALMQSGSQARNSLSHPGLVAGSLHPGQAVLLEGMALHASMLQGTLKPQSADLGKLLALLGGVGTEDAAGVDWPGTESKSWRGLSGEVVPPKQAMQNLLMNLASSSLFAARHLADTLGPKLLHPSGLDDASLMEETTKVLENLSSDSASAKEAARLLLHGQLFWQGELMPGVKGKLTREDAWENDPDHEGQLMKGSKISLEVNLPRAGIFKVIGVQFGDVLRLRIETAEKEKSIFQKSLSELDDRFKEQIAIPVNYVLSDIAQGNHES